MKEKLIDYFKSQNKYVSVRDIIKYFKIDDKDYSLLMNVLYELEASGFIIKGDGLTYMRLPKESIYQFGIVKESIKKNKYIDLGHGNIALIRKDQRKNIKEGDKVYYIGYQNEKNKHQYLAEIVRIITLEHLDLEYKTKATIIKNYKKNYYYIIKDEKMIVVPKEYLNGAHEGDEVSVKISYNNNIKIAKVENIISRKKDLCVFKVVKGQNGLVLKSISTGEEIKVTNGMQENDLYLYRIDENNHYQLVEKLESLTNEIDAYAIEYGLETNFSKQVIDEVNKLDTSISEHELATRVDLRNLPTVTIDDEHSKDLDDAISLEKVGDNYLLYVSIADVSHYVKPGSCLFESAKKRSTSIYPANKVIPMFPARLSNGICSLNEKEDKLAKTIKLEITPNGEIIDFNIFSSVIRSDKKMTYNKVNNLLNGLDYDKDYLPFYTMLINMNELSNILQTRRMNRGFICLNIDEYALDFNDKDDVENVSTRERGLAHLIIENFMLIANEMVADYLSYLEVTGSFRCHASPSLNSLYKMKEQIPSMKKYLLLLSKAQNPKMLQKILLNLIKDKDEDYAKFISKELLSNLTRAYYSTKNIGHYGLALNHYLTFTSPIRRFPDLLNHLVIDAILDEKYEMLPEITKDYEKMCIHSSEMAYLSDKFEKYIAAVLLNRYFLKKKQEIINAKVLYINNSHIFIRTNDDIYGIILLSEKDIRKPYEVVSINGYNIKRGDTIEVKYETINESFSEIVFTIVPKNINNEKTLKKRKKE